MTLTILKVYACAVALPDRTAVRPRIHALFSYMRHHKDGGYSQTTGSPEVSVFVTAITMSGHSLVGKRSLVNSAMHDD